MVATVATPCPVQTGRVARAGRGTATELAAMVETVPGLEVEDAAVMDLARARVAKAVKVETSREPEAGVETVGAPVREATVAMVEETREEQAVRAVKVGPAMAGRLGGTAAPVALDQLLVEPVDVEAMPVVEEVEGLVERVEAAKPGPAGLEAMEEMPEQSTVV